VLAQKPTQQKLNVPVVPNVATITQTLGVSALLLIKKRRVPSLKAKRNKLKLL
jgi:hypothetical protein